MKCKCKENDKKCNCGYGDYGTYGACCEHQDCKKSCKKSACKCTDQDKK